jgi:hypothetical protein
MIVDIEEQLGLAASAGAFAAEYPEEGDGEEEEDSDEEVQPRTSGQQHRHSLMQHLLGQL